MLPMRLVEGKAMLQLPMGLAESKGKANPNPFHLTTR